jgi:hypothetical protein
MKRSGFANKPRKPLKRTPLARISATRSSKLTAEGAKPKKTAISTKRAKKMNLKRNLCEQYGLPIIPCSRWGTAKAPTRTDLLRGMLWTVFSKYIRERDKDKPCISCSKTFGIKQAGHYLPVGNSSVGTWFDEMNVHGECEKCNAFDTYHLVPMRKNLVKLYGEEAIEALDQRKNISVKIEEIEYVDLIKKYL